MRIWIDGEERQAAKLERLASMDVEAATSNGENRTRARFRAEYQLGADEGGPHSAVVIFQTADNRLRRVDRHFSFEP
jgi:hypothetical protein